MSEPLYIRVPFSSRRNYTASRQSVRFIFASSATDAAAERLLIDIDDCAFQDAISDYLPITPDCVTLLT